MAVTTYQQGSTLPLPANIPTKTVCIELDLPDDPDFFRLFYGALDALSNWFAYDRDTAKTGRLVAALWRKVIRSIRPCPGPGVQLVCGGCGDCCDCGGCMTVGYRQQGCLFQKFDCLTGQWVTVYDGSLCVTNPAPGGGITPPPAGMCQDYTLFPKANAITPLPFLINAGDTITVTSEMGAGSDGTLNWYCPDGSYFVAGGCAGGGGTNPADPLPTTKHMALILRVGSSYYPLPVGTFTVPSGISNVQGYVQVNDASLTDDSGEYTVSLNYCNNQAVTPGAWCHNIDFTLTPGFFNPQAFHNGSGDLSAPFRWVSGTGWVCAVTAGSLCSCDFLDSWIELDMGATANVTAYEVDWQPFAPGINGQYADSQISAAPDFTSGNHILFQNTGFTAAGPLTPSGGVTAPGRYVRIYTAFQATGVLDPGVVITRIRLSGTGANPFGSSNC